MKEFKTIDEVRKEMKGLYLNGHSLSAILERLHVTAEPFVSLMTDYKCASMEVETKFNVLNSRLSVYGEMNPIESIKSRIKSPESILMKMERKNLPFDLDSIRNNITDVAGVRVICSFVDDIYRLEELFLSQDDIVLTKRKDYIESPKENGYRSLHLIVEVPIFTESGKRNVSVEVQMRTIAMDFWASLEHKLRYKKDISPEMVDALGEDLKKCALDSADLDRRMEEVKKKLYSQPEV